MDVILAPVTPSVANNSLPPPPRADRRKSNTSKGSGAVKSEKYQSLAPRDPKSSFEARLPYLPGSPRRPSAPATYYNGPFPTGSSRSDEKLDGPLQLNNVPPMLFRGHFTQASMERPTEPTPPEDYSDAFYSLPTKLPYANAPLSSSRSVERSTEWDPNHVYVPHAFQYRQHDNSSNPISTGRNPPDSTPLPTSLLEPQTHAAKANKLLGISASNIVSLQSGYTEHQPRRGSAEYGVQSSRNSKANKLLALAPEGSKFAPPPRLLSSGQYNHTVTAPLRGASDLERVHSKSSDRARLGSAGSTQEIEDSGRWRRESFMDFSPSIPSHQKSKSQPETLSRPSGSATSLRTVFSIVSTDSDIPLFSKRRPESIGKSQPSTTLKVFKDLMKRTDGETKYEQTEYEREKVVSQEADFDLWGWGVSSSAQEQKPNEWAEACTLPDEDREEQYTPKQTTQDLFPAQSASANALDQKERLAVIRKKRKIAQLLGMDIPPYTLGPAVQDGTPTERRESWEPLNNQETIYLDTQGIVREGMRLDDSSGAVVPKGKRRSRLPSSILNTNDEFVLGIDMGMNGPDSPTSFMELSDEELDSHKGKANRPLPPQFNRATVIGPPTPTKASMGPSALRSDRTFSTVTIADLPLFPAGSQTLKHKPSFITEILEDSDWEAKERKKKRDKLAKMHRFLGSRVPAELVLGCSSGTIPPTALLHEEDEEDTGRVKDRGHGPNVGWNNEREMRNLGTMGGSEKMVQIKRAQKIEKMFGEQPPSALLRPGASLQPPSTLRPSSSPPSRAAYALSHSAFRPGVPYSTSGPTPFATNVAHNVNLLYGDLPSSDRKYKNKRKDKFVPSLSPISTINKTNSDSSLISSAAGSMTGLISDFKEQERGWKGKARPTTSPKDMARPTDSLSAPLYKRSSHDPPQLSPLSHSAQFVHYRNSFKSLAVIIDLGDKPALEELYAMLNSTSPAGSDTEAELAYTKPIRGVSGYESDPASPTGGLSHRSLRSRVSMASIASGSSFFTLTPEPMGFQARRKRAAKLTNFFGASYRDLFGEVLEKLEIGFLEEAKEGGLSTEEVVDLMGHVRTLRGRQTEI